MHSQREIWNGQPEELRELFVLSRAGRANACCTLWSHVFGWELRLSVNDSLVRSQVCRAVADAMTASDEWQAAMRAEGWC